MAKIAEVRARIDNAAKITEVDVRHKEGQIGRAETDLARRELDGELSRQQSSEVHAARIAGYTNREAREVTLHELDVELKELMIEIRRRAAGFTDTLHHSDERTGAAKAAAAQFAAADATRDLSPDAEAARQAYEERFIHDTGLDPEDFFADNGANQSDRRLHSVDDDVGGLAADLTMDANLHHEFGYLAHYLAPTTAPAAEVIIDAEIVEDGEWIEAAVSATAVHDVDHTAADPDLTSGGADPTPARGTGTELEIWRGDLDVGRGR
ncbi:hypothetical protein [Nocardia neocaledoniensis]|uniref:hypothetical protein n=1 Tax=Nocardia neocaledoniensis TaxID=236511 RepID=UPI002457B64F|nr:hypothetical protein [Nocardia neocaledoniensis]